MEPKTAVRNTYVIDVEEEGVVDISGRCSIRDPVKFVYINIKSKVN